MVSGENVLHIDLNVPPGKPKGIYWLLRLAPNPLFQHYQTSVMCQLIRTVRTCQNAHCGQNQILAIRVCPCYFSLINKLPYDACRIKQLDLVFEAPALWLPWVWKCDECWLEEIDWTPINVDLNWHNELLKQS